VDLHGKQFRFPVPLKPSAPEWLGYPTSFRVILLGQVKDWPKKEVIHEIVQAVPSKSMDAWILWVVYTLYRRQFCSGGLSTCFIIPLITMLADGVHGPITPQKYCDLLVLEEENKKRDLSSYQSDL